MLTCITATLLIHLTTISDGSITIRGDYIESYQRGDCRVVDDWGGMFRSTKTHLEPCTHLSMKSGKSERVKETPEEISRLLENKNGK